MVAKISWFIAGGDSLPSRDKFWRLFPEEGSDLSTNSSSGLGMPAFRFQEELPEPSAVSFSLGPLDESLFSIVLFTDFRCFLT